VQGQVSVDRPYSQGGRDRHLVPGLETCNPYHHCINNLQSPVVNEGNRVDDDGMPRRSL
jgi:hypothetical protein